MKNLIQFSAGISKVQTMADGTLQIRLETQELPTAQMVQIFQFKREMCMVGIAPFGEKIEAFDPATFDIPQEKSPSKRLRGVLYKVWESDNQGYNDFDQYYPVKMNEIISHFKSKLD